MALTRTKNKVYLLVDQNADKQSDFIKEYSIYLEQRFKELTGVKK